MSSFKPGDKVVCVNPDYDNSIQEGAVYTVAPQHPDHNYDGNWVALEGVQGYRFSSRFELAKEKDMSMAHRLRMKAEKAKEEIDARNLALAETKRKAAEQYRLKLSKAFSTVFENLSRDAADKGLFSLDLDFKEAIDYGETNVRNHLQLEGFQVRRERRRTEYYDDEYGSQQSNGIFVLVAYWS